MKLRCCYNLLKSKKVMLTSLLVVSMTTYLISHSVDVTRRFNQLRNSQCPSTKLSPQQATYTRPQNHHKETLHKQYTTDKSPKLPLDFLHKPKIKREFNSSCAKFPNLFEIKIHNTIWQSVKLKEGKDLYLFSAHFDNRNTVLNQGKSGTSTPVVRLLALTTHSYLAPLEALCQFWYDDKTRPIFSGKATFTYIWNFKWGYSPEAVVPVLISCPLPYRNETRSPDVVSFVEKKCDKASNALKVQHAPPEMDTKEPPKGSIGVCISALAYWSTDRSYHLLEWLELLRLLGVDKVYIYELALHPNMEKVIQHYADLGFVDRHQYNLAGDQVNSPELITLLLRAKTVQTHYNKVLPYNDCLYRNWYKHEYLVAMDTDEVILPAESEMFTWKELLTTVLKNTTSTSTSQNSTPMSSFSYSSICGRNVHFVNNVTDLVKENLPNDVPPYLYMLTHLTRAAEFEQAGSGTKCFHSTSRVFTLHNHLPFECVGKCKALHISPSMAHMQHYRSDCSIAASSRCRVGKLSNATVLDATIWKYKEDLIERCNDVLQELDLLK